MQSRGLRIGVVTLRVLLAALFALSAVAKMVAIDDFELYIFSYGILPLNLSYIAARLCIGAELALSVLIAMGVWRKWVSAAAVWLLIVFSIFLCYAVLVGRTDSCQCFGRWADMPPALSLLKNAVLIVIVLLYMRGAALMGRLSSCKAARWVAVAGAVVCIVVPFVVSVPDNWMFGPEEVRIDHELFASEIGSGGQLESYAIGDGRKLVAFVTPGCPYCRMARQKLGSIAERHGIGDDKIIYLEPDQIGVGVFMAITRGMRPLVMLVDGGEIVATYHYRNIDERQIDSFLNYRVEK